MANTQKLFEKAEKLLQKQKFDSAQKIFLKLLEVQPQNEAVLLNLADLAIRLDQPEGSLSYNRQLADLYIERKDVSKAIVACRKILKAAPQNASTLAKLASLLKQARKTTEAVDTFSEAVDQYRCNGKTAEAIECLQQMVALEPGNIEAHVELAELASESDKKALAASALLKAAAIVRKKKMEDRWAELAERAHRLDPANDEGRLAAAEVCLTTARAHEAIALLEPLSLSKPDDATVMNLLCRAYLSTAEYEKAEPLCLKIYQADSETIGLAEQLIRGLLSTGETGKALSLVEGIKEQMYRRQEKKAEFLALIEQIYHADENNLQALELLPPLYNELNREGDLPLSLARLFSLYLADGRYSNAAEILEAMLDVDPYGASHADRLLNLEGHIDAIWYSNIVSRISLPGMGHGLSPDSPTGSGTEAETGAPATLDDLMIEAEMYHRYHLTEKLEETLRKINRLYPGAHEENESLSELYELVDFHPAPVERPAAKNSTTQQTGTDVPAEPSHLAVEQLRGMSTITASVHRQVSPEQIVRVAADQLGRLLDSSRCWLALGSAETGQPLTAEYVSSGIAPSDPNAALKIWSFLMRRAANNSEGWPIDDVSAEGTLTPIAPEMQIHGIRSLLVMPLMDKEEPTGLLLAEQCGEARRWTSGEITLLRTVASQVAIAINNTKLRRLLRSLAGTDPATGLLPRSAYFDCLLAEATRAEEQSRPLSICLMEPVRAADLFRDLGEAQMCSYSQHVGGAVFSHVRQNDIAIRYGPWTIALCLPDTPLARSRIVIEKLQASLNQSATNAEMTTGFCATVGDLLLGGGFDAVDAVTEIINRLEASMETMRNRSEAGILVSRFEG
jgi:tetratricopeptide (TPR) repeat protein/GGDEF domain-containing protein